jgi:hypothetical protein
MRYFVEISSFHFDRGEDSAKDEFFVVDAEDHEKAVLAAMKPKDDEWPFEEPWSTMVDESEKDRQGTYYSNYYGDWQYNLLIREATKKDIKRVEKITEVKKALREWINKTVKIDDAVTRRYGTFWLYHILAHALADLRVRRKSRDELVDYLYQGDEPTYYYNEDKLAEVCLKEIGDVKAVIKVADRFFKRRFPKSIKKATQRRKNAL